MTFLHCILCLMVLLQPAVPLLRDAAPARLSVLLRDAADAGVAGATLTLRQENGQIITLTTDATGVAISGPLAGGAVWLLDGRRADGTPLPTDHAPGEVGFYLGLIPGQTRAVLLRLDGDRIVLDPDMIFSPGEPGEPAPPTPPQLAATGGTSAAPPVAGDVQPVVAGPTDAPPAVDRTPWWFIPMLICACGLIALAGLGLALLVRRARP